MSDLTQIERYIGSFSTNPNIFTKELEYQTESYYLTWHEIYVILSSSLTSEEKELFD